MTLAPRPTRAGARRAAIAAMRAPQRAVLLAAGALLLAACSSGSEGTERQLKTAATATATAQAALSAWLAGDAPADYARRTVSTMRERLAKAAEEVAASEAGAAARRAALLNRCARPGRRSGAPRRRSGPTIGPTPRARAPRPRRRRRASPSLPPATGRRRDEQAAGDLARHRHERRRLPRGRLAHDRGAGRRRLRLQARLGDRSRYDLHHLPRRDGGALRGGEPSHHFRRDPRALRLQLLSVAAHRDAVRQFPLARGRDRRRRDRARARHRHRLSMVGAAGRARRLAAAVEGHLRLHREGRSMLGLVTLCFA